VDLFLKAITGAIVVLLIHFAATSKNYYLAGLIPLFPTFSLISHYMIGKERQISDLSETILFGIFSLIPLLVYLITLYLFINKFSLIVSLCSSTLSWGLAAIVLTVAWNMDRAKFADRKLSVASSHQAGSQAGGSYLPFNKTFKQ